MQSTADICVIGGGIVGMTICRRLKLAYPQVTIALLEKESQVCLHSSGRNSGVLHAGVLRYNFILKIMKPNIFATCLYAVVRFGCVIRWTLFQMVQFYACKSLINFYTALCFVTCQMRFPKFVSGFYYSADSLKARFCREGNRLLTEYCDERKIQLNRYLLSPRRLY